MTAKAAYDGLGLRLFEFPGGIRAKVLPLAMMNILNGGMRADNDLYVQEFMILPWGAANFSGSLCRGVEVYQSLREALKTREGC